VRVLVTAASKHESTADIAARLAKLLTEQGHSAAYRRPDEVETLEGYDAVVLGSGIYAGQWLKPATEFVERHRAALLERPVWLFSSGPVGSPAKPEGDAPVAVSLAESLAARGHRTFTGRLERGRLGLAERAITAALRVPDGDFRDWAAIAAWAQEIASALRTEPVPA
jgi:menaquinone-dependent protoporphyrinogen oxidase